MSGETPDLSGGIGGGAGPGGGASAGGVGAGGAGAGGAGAGAGTGGTGGFGGILGSQIGPILVAGGLSGILAMGALIALSIVPVHSGGSGASPRGLVLVACPASGPVLAVIDPGQKLLVTGRSSDGAWLQVYLPGPALPYAWAPASELQPTGDTGTLPVASCEVAASPAGTPIVAVVSPTPSPTPTPPPTPSATPVNSSPIIADMAASPATIFWPWGGIGPSCGPDAKDPDTTTISATITDPQGIASATLFYRLPKGPYASKTMTRSGSTYAATLQVPNGFGKIGDLDYYIVSKDGSAAGKTRTSPFQAVTVRKCDVPPTVTNAFIDGQLLAIEVPLKSGGMPCPSSNINNLTVTAYATDIDGTVAKIVLYYTPHGSTTVQSLVLKKISASSAFSAHLTNDKFPKLKSSGKWIIPRYVVAFDDAGRTSARFTTGSQLVEQNC